MRSLFFVGCLLLVALCQGIHQEQRDRDLYIKDGHIAQADEIDIECNVRDWNNQTIYDRGHEVLLNGTLYRCKFWNEGKQPDLQPVSWDMIGACHCVGVPAFDPYKTYGNNHYVRHSGQLYKARWWTKGKVPARVRDNVALTLNDHWEHISACKTLINEQENEKVDIIDWSYAAPAPAPAPAPASIDGVLAATPFDILNAEVITPEQRLQIEAPVNWPI